MTSVEGRSILITGVAAALVSVPRVILSSAAPGSRSAVAGKKNG